MRHSAVRVEIELAQVKINVQTQTQQLCRQWRDRDRNSVPVDEIWSEEHKQSFLHSNKCHKWQACQSLPSPDLDIWPLGWENVNFNKNRKISIEDYLQTCKSSTKTEINLDLS